MITATLSEAAEALLQQWSRALDVEHEHYTVSYAFGRKQTIWSTRDECVKCGNGREWR